MKKNPINHLVRISRPVLLLGGISLYMLGVGIAKYLGKTIDWPLFTLGLAWIIIMQWVAHLIHDYFEGSNTTDVGSLSREAKKVFIGAGLAALAVLVILIMRFGEIKFPWVVISLLIFLVAFFYVLRPFRLIYSGFGEISLAILFGNLVPSFAYLLQFEEMNRLLMIISIPLVFLIASLLIAIQFESYASDLKANRRSLLARLGWENGMFLHNTFILLAFIVLGLGGIFGLPSAIVLPAFLPLPLALLQLWHIRQINAGGKPNWRFLSFNAIAIVALIVYILTYIFWNR